MMPRQMRETLRPVRPSCVYCMWFESPRSRQRKAELCRLHDNALPLMKTRHFAQLVAMSDLWGASFPFIRVASPALGPWGVAGIRCALAAAVLALLMRLLGQKWPARAGWPALVRLGFFTLVGPFLLFNWAALHIPAGYSAVLNATMPLFGAVFAAMLG